MQIKRILAVCMVLLAVFSLFTACTRETIDSTSPQTSGNQQNSSEQGTTQQALSDDERFFGKYETPVTINLAISTNAAVDFPQGDSYINNVWTRGWKEDLNIEAKEMWQAVAATGSYLTKMNLAIASNQLPDIMILGNYSQYERLQKNGRLEDLTDGYNNYLYPVAKDFVANQDDGLSLSWFQENGKQMGMPNGGINFDSTRMVFIRHDWFVESGLPAPKTIEDVINIAKAFKNKEPKNRLGLALNNKVLDESMCDITGIANAVGAYPRIWLDGGDGKLVYGTIQPEMKKVLQIYADMYKEGLIDPAFASIDGNKVGEQLTSGKLGVVIGNFWLPTWPLNSLWDQSGVDWDVYPLPPSSTLEGKLRVQTFTPEGLCVAVRKGFEHPEALFKIINYNTSKIHDPEKAELKKFHSDPSDPEKSKYQYFMFNPISILYGPARSNMDMAKEITEAVDKKDPSILKNPQSLDRYNAITKYLEDTAAGRKPEMSGWVSIKGYYGPNSTFNIENKYYNEGSYLTSKLVGYQSPEMVRQWQNLKQLEEVFITQVISGTKSVDDFDQFIGEWRNAGGETIEYEVNEWYKSLK